MNTNNEEEEDFIPYTFIEWFRDHQNDENLQIEYANYFKKTVANIELAGQPVLYKEWCAAKYGTEVMKANV